MDDRVVAVVGRRLERVLLGDVRASVLRRPHRGPEVGPAVKESGSASVQLERIKGPDVTQA